jgi:hypothetical protein
MRNAGGPRANSERQPSKYVRWCLAHEMRVSCRSRWPQTRQACLTGRGRSGPFCSNDRGGDRTRDLRIKSWSVSRRTHRPARSEVRKYANKSEWMSTIANVGGHSKSQAESHSTHTAPRTVRALPKVTIHSPLP